MKYIHIRSLEKYHPGYKDRNLIWCKVYFKMVNSDPEFELLCEIDKWRFIAFIMLEIQLQKPVPIDEKYLIRKGFDLKKRAIRLTLEMLHNFIDISEEPLQICNTDKIREDKSREDKIYSNKLEIINFWNEQGIIKHNVPPIPDDLDRILTKRLKETAADKIKYGIETYAIVQLDPKATNGKRFFFDYKWTLAEFLKRESAWNKFVLTDRRTALDNHIQRKGVCPDDVFKDYGIKCQ